MAGWQCEGSMVTKASRPIAWAYWTDLSNHAALEPGVERIELDGPFVTGTRGRTISAESAQEWELIDVVEEQRFGIAGKTAAGTGGLSFEWDFSDEGGGTRVTYRIRAFGPEVKQHMPLFRQMEASVPMALDRLAKEMDRIAGG